MSKTQREQEIIRLVGEVPDPEIPVVTIQDLGILRQVQVLANGEVVVDITPTYSGCPAMKAIEQSIVSALAEAGVENVTVNLVLSPAWSTDWISDNGRQKMKAYGIAPPAKISCGQGSEIPLKLERHPTDFLDGLFTQPTVACPRCDSTDTRQLSVFGSTACKSLWQCNQCHEPFDYFKCH